MSAWEAFLSASVVMVAVAILGIGVLGIIWCAPWLTAHPFVAALGFIFFTLFIGFWSL